MFAFLYHIIVSHLDIVVRKGERGNRKKISMEGKNNDNNEKEKENKFSIDISIKNIP